MTAGRHVIGQSQEWGTPKKYVDAITTFFGGEIDLDPCSNNFSIVHAKTEYTLPKHNGLREPWNFRTIYVNPPYGIDQESGTSIRQWLRRCEEAYRLYSSEVIALVPVATNTGHWKNSVYGKANAVCFLHDTRVKFLENGQEGGKGAPMSCCLIYWGDRFADFSSHFQYLGAVVSVKDVQLPNTRENRQLQLAV
ncbi:MAG TPA: DNA N-6-adenine-methyltransferase [Acidobacteriaceae bacterium]|nr:DNA N-6-adenine-methyltransferase [Acidobacteriaceae bacterium]